MACAKAATGLKNPIRHSALQIGPTENGPNKQWTKAEIKAKSREDQGGEKTPTSTLSSHLVQKPNFKFHLPNFKIMFVKNLGATCLGKRCVTWTTNLIQVQSFVSLMNLAHSKKWNVLVIDDFVVNPR